MGYRREYSGIKCQWGGKWQYRVEEGMQGAKIKNKGLLKGSLESMLL